MSKITVGKIMNRADDIRRNILWDSLGPLRKRGFETGVFIVEISEDISLTIRIGTKELALLRQMDGFLTQIIEQNKENLIFDSESDENLLTLAWKSLGAVRTVGYGDGDYSVRFPEEITLNYFANYWNAVLLRRFDEFLGDLYETNRVYIDEIIFMSSSDVSEMNRRAA